MKFTDPDCAFDIRANVAGAGPVTWAGVNLCDVKSVTLKRDDRQARGSTTTNKRAAPDRRRDKDRSATAGSGRPH